MAFAAVVLFSDAAPLGHLNVPPDQATDLPAVASLVNISVNDDTPVATGYLSVIVAFPVRVAVKTPPSTISKLIAVPVFPNATNVSANADARMYDFADVTAEVRVSVFEVLGATPAPPPTMISFELSTLELAIVVVSEKYNRLPELPEFNPVPPVDTASVPDVALDALSVVRPDPLPIKIPFDVML